MRQGTKLWPLVALAFTVAVATAATVSAQEAEYPVLSLARARLALGGNYEWYAPTGSEPAPTFEKEWSAGAYGAYALVPKLSAIGSVGYFFDNQFVRVALGSRYTFYHQDFDLALGLHYEWFHATGPEPEPVFNKEFAVGLYGGYGLNRWLGAVGSTSYGMDNKTVRSYLGLRALLYRGEGN